MNITRFYTSPTTTPYAGITFLPREITIPATGERTTFIAPEHWSLQAVTILATKYARRAGVPLQRHTVDEPGIPLDFQRSLPAEGTTYGAETDARHIFDRLAGAWTYWGLKGHYFDTTGDAQAYYDEMCAMLARQIGAPNSPQWFNTGLHWAYGITGEPIGYWRAPAPNAIAQPTESTYEYLSPFACFILATNDTLCEPQGILDTFATEARIFKMGAGAGANYSAWREAGAPLSGGGTSSGLMSFLPVGDRNAGSIKSGGTTRRAARMIVLNADHPDIEAFVSWKPREELKVAALVAGSFAIERHLNTIVAAITQSPLQPQIQADPTANVTLANAIRTARAASIPDGAIRQAIDLARQGIAALHIDRFSTDWDGAGYASVSAQNANNSIRLPDAFFTALDRNQPWDLHARTTGAVARTIPARDLWEAIVLAAWQCADPGLQFDDTIQAWHTTPADGRINATNPCAEYASIDNSACNLASVNLVKYLNTDGTFAIDQFSHDVGLWTITLEISVFGGQLPTKAIAENTARLRNLGLGYSNLGALLMRLGLPYDSPHARTWAAAITALHQACAYETSAKLAAQLGPYGSFEANREATLRVLRNHARAAGTIDGPFEHLPIAPVLSAPTLSTANVWAAANMTWQRVLDAATQHGVRNAQVTVIAPAGTIGLLMDCDTTGCEPDFALIKYKKLAGGGYLSFTNASIEPALRTLGYDQRAIQAILHHILGSRTLEDAPHVNPARLRELGLSDDEIDQAQHALPGAFTLELAFNSITLSDTTRTRLHLDDAHTDQTYSLLRALGYSASDIDAADAHVCGHRCVEGAPFLHPEHLPVFDCATPASRSTRAIAPDAHLGMLGAIQPFVSGSISKTVNVPNDTTIETIGQLYRQAHDLGLKCVSVYRDGSKLSQPLATSLALLDGDTIATTDAPNAGQVAERIVYRYLAQKRSLPTKRRGYTQKLTVNGIRFYLRTGEYEDGQLGEVFIDGQKEGATFRAMLNNFAIAVSIALQHGVPLEEFVDAFTFTKFEPNGIVADHAQIKHCSSLIDAFFRDLAINYLGRKDLAHLPNGTLAHPQPTIVHETNGDGRYGAASRKSTEPPHTTSTSAVTTGAQAAKDAGFTGEPCWHCGGFKVVRTGTCSRCLDCDSSSAGCS